MRRLTLLARQDGKRAGSNRLHMASHFRHGIVRWRLVLLVLYFFVAEDYKDINFLRAFGVVVKRHREAKGASQEHLAELAGLHRTYVSDIERGIRNLTVSSASRIANGLSVSISSLIAEAEQYLSEVESGIRPRINGFH